MAAKLVIADPPVAPAVKATFTNPLLNALPDPTSVAVPIVGACGTVVAVIEPDVVDGPFP